ncbi:MAG: SDR family NAD(P)-dependent oxidoreductase [Saprospiraceae bacterium]
MEKVLITGGTGFLGRALAQKLKREYQVFICGRNNTQNSFAQMTTGCQAIPADIASMESIRDAFNQVNPDIVIHAAATKFVDISEREPFEAVDINVNGSANVARLAIDRKCKMVIGISTDKAAPPITNTYALTKALMERMYCTSNGRSETKFACVRFGNIAWSSGSVFPIWKKMVRLHGKIESTGPHMRRYLISADKAAELVIRAIDNIDLIQGGVLIPDMKAILIKDVLNIFAEQAKVEWVQIPSRPGERVDEYLLGEAELEYSHELMIDNLKHFLYSPNKKSAVPITTVVSSQVAEHFTNDEILSFINEDPSDS